MVPNVGVTQVLPHTLSHIPCSLPNAPPLTSPQHLAAAPTGRGNITSAMRLCPSANLSSADDVIMLRDWLAAAWDYMAMGNFPYPSRCPSPTCDVNHICVLP